ncbi:hypothetical protein N7478_011576 [Penicillium angulare]|uniref:uncharacterized protein n=1 Tax=Penicillium angulare TaxID=116970 RepID=UPI002541EFA9|nr:uncharacterized protein N7478_011576 [Penicillium angulare]KAJ5263971.1 hypothetical protein N7478_011576 [Penicillium angulare]
MDEEECKETVQELKTWLEKTDSDSPASEYRKHLNSHARGTGEWILETPQYKQWSQIAAVRNIWIRGIPGCGKSVVAASLISRLRRRGDGIVLFFFFREIIQTNRSPRSLIQDFCHELVDYSPPLVASLKKLMQKHYTVASVPFENLWKSFITCLGSIKQPVFCVVDALDEMKRGKESDQFLDDFLNRKTPDTVKVLLTSRQVPHVERHMNGACLVDLRLDRRNVDRDIAVYLTQRLEDSQLGIPLETAEVLKKAICDRGKGLFLYARLMFDKLLLHPDDISSQIDALPDGLGDMYSDILHEHASRSGTSSDFQRLILEWVIHSSRPMRLLELAVMVDSLPNRGGLDPSIAAKMGIRTTCGPLLEDCDDGVVQIIHHSLTEFALNRDVAHTQMSHQKRDFAALDSPSVHAMIARTCLQYLKNATPKERIPLTDLEYGRVKTEKRAEIYLESYFLQYSVSEWLFHAANAPESDDNLFNAIIEFFQPENPTFEFWERLWRYDCECSYERPYRKDKELIPPLFIATHYGMKRLACHFLQNGTSPDICDTFNLTPLLYAIQRGHDDMVRLLLQHQARHDIGSNDGMPVHVATEYNNVKVLQSLIAFGADLTTNKKKDSSGGKYRYYGESYEAPKIQETPFLIACRLGHIETLVLLMSYCQKSHLLQGLHTAVLGGQLKAVEALLQSPDVRDEINHRDSDGNTALYTASKKRRSDTVKCLLNHGADANVLSMNLNTYPEPRSSSLGLSKSKIPPSYTPLHGWAIGPSHLLTSTFDSYEVNRKETKKKYRIGNDVLDVFLAAGCDINATDHLGRSALFFWPHFYDAKATDPWISVRTLLRNGADVSTLDNTGASPLHAKRDLVAFEVLRILTDSGMDINAPRRTDGATPLMVAACLDDTDPIMFKALNADFNQQDLVGNTALSYFLKDSSRWKLPVVEDWIRSSDVNLQNSFGRTPFLQFLHYYNSWNSPVPLFNLMTQYGMSIHTRDFTGKNALLTVLSKWEHIWDYCDHMFQRFLELGLDPHEADNEGKSGLHWVAKHKDGGTKWGDGCTKISNILVQAGASPHALDKDGNSIIHELMLHAAEWETLEIRCKNLLDLGCPVQTRNNQGRTALHLAVAIEDCGWEEDSHGYKIADILTRVEFLLQPSIPCDVNAMDRTGITPLHLAAAISDMNTTTLIKAGAKMDARDSEGHTPLHFAAEAGQSNALGLLVELYVENSINIDGLTLKGRSALHYASRSGEPECVRLLTQAGANVGIRDERNRTPLHAAAELHYAQEAQEAQKAQRMYDAAPSRMRESPARYGQLAWQDIIERGSSVVANERSNRSVRQVVQLLLAAGADPTIADENGHWPIDVATMLGCADIVDELRNSTSAESPTAFDKPAELLMALTESVPMMVMDNVSLPENHVKFLERVFSTGNEQLIGKVLTSKQVKVVEEKGDSALHLVARWGWTSVMTQVLPHVEDMPSLLPSLLKHATDRDLCNISMIEYLASFIPDVLDKEAFTNSLIKLAHGSRWWHPHGLSILLRAGATPNGPEDRFTHDRPLHSALLARHTWHWRDDTARILLEHGADPNANIQLHGNSPLNIAINVNRSVEIIELIIQKGGSLSAGSESGPPIVAAISSKRDDVLELFLESGADPNGTDSHNPLVSAANPKASEAALSILLRYGANPLHPMYNNESTAFHDICRANYCIQRFVSTGLDLNARDGKGCTPLLKACMKCPERDEGKVVLALTNLDVDVNAIDKSGSLALHHAVRTGYLSAVQALLEHGAETTHCNHESFTPLRSALKKYADESYIAELDCGSGNVDNPTATYHDIVTALLDAGANPLEVFHKGKTALHYVAVLVMDYSNIDRKYQLETENGADHFTPAWNLYNRLLNAGCDPAARNEKGETALFSFVKAPKSWHGSWCNDMPERYANQEDCAKMAEWHGLREVDNDGNTLLHAIAYRDWDYEADDYEANLFQIFVDLGLSPWTENKSGLTALDIAATHEKEEILALFARDD